MPDEIGQDVRTAFKRVSARVAAALEALWRRLPEGSRIEDAAKDLKIHRTTLLRWFHDDLGMSPKQALQQLRLARALRMMKKTDEPLAMVAMQSGYGTFQAMVRHFRQVFRTTPAQIRAQLVSGRALAPGPCATDIGATERVKKHPAPLSPAIALTDHQPLTTDH
jgi:transcriptional regulator GlxA family with amidase domain